MDGVFMCRLSGWIGKCAAPVCLTAKFLMLYV